MRQHHERCAARLDVAALDQADQAFEGRVHRGVLAREKGRAKGVRRCARQFGWWTGPAPWRVALPRDRPRGSAALQSATERAQGIGGRTGARLLLPLPPHVTTARTRRNRAWTTTAKSSSSPEPPRASATQAAKAFAQRGATVVAVARREALLQKLIDECRGAVARVVLCRRRSRRTRGFAERRDRRRRRSATGGSTSSSTTPPSPSTSTSTTRRPRRRSSSCG